MESDAEPQGKIDHLVVVGGGTAGFIAAITCKYKLRDLKVTVVRSKEIGVIGVGEGTTPVVLTHLHGYLNLNLESFYRRAEPTWKSGVRFLWGPHAYYNYTFSNQFVTVVPGLRRRNGFYGLKDPLYADPASALMSEGRVFLQKEKGIPLIGKDLAYHLENVTFVNYLEEVAMELGVEVLDDKVVDVATGECGVVALELQGRGRFGGDFFVDASGFRAVLMDGALGEPWLSFGDSLFCDRAVTGGWERGEDEPIKPYTTSETMDSGWCWQVELEKRVNRGYVYSGAFISDEAAEAEFRKANPKVGDTRVVKFKSGRRERAWVKNVVGIGNACGFVEPLESTSLGAICDDAQALAESLAACELRPNATMAAEFSDRCRRIWESIRNFLSVHYRFNRRRETPFWKECNEKVELHGAQRVVDYFRENGPSTLFGELSVDRIDQFQIEGYLTHLIGLGAPCEWDGEISAKEWEGWEGHRGRMRKLAQDGFTVEGALEVVRRPEWKWTTGFYKG